MLHILICGMARTNALSKNNLMHVYVYCESYKKLTLRGLKCFFCFRPTAERTLECQPWLCVGIPVIFMHTLCNTNTVINICVLPHMYLPVSSTVPVSVSVRGTPSHFGEKTNVKLPLPFLYVSVYNVGFKV